MGQVSAAATLRVWWIPQIPMKAFKVDVESVQQGKFLLDALAKYDLFQYENNVKPDYCNMGGLSVLEDDGEWLDLTEDEVDDYFAAINGGAA